MPCIAHLEALVAKVKLAPLKQRLLLMDVASQFGGVLHVGIWRDERITFFNTITLG